MHRNGESRHPILFSSFGSYRLPYWHCTRDRSDLGVLPYKLPVPSDDPFGCGLFYHEGTDGGLITDIRSLRHLVESEMRWRIGLTHVWLRSTYDEASESD